MVEDPDHCRVAATCIRLWRNTDVHFLQDDVIEAYNDLYETSVSLYTVENCLSLLLKQNLIKLIPGETSRAASNRYSLENTIERLDLILDTARREYCDGKGVMPNDAEVPVESRKRARIE